MPIILNQSIPRVGFKSILLRTLAHFQPQDVLTANDVMIEIKTGEEPKIFHRYGNEITSPVCIFSGHRKVRRHNGVSSLAFTMDKFPFVNPPLFGRWNKIELMAMASRIANIPRTTWGKMRNGVIKPYYGFGGKGIRRGRNSGIVQDQIRNPYGHFDMRIICFLGEIIGAYLRINARDWRSNTHCGGHPVSIYKARRRIVHHEIQEEWERIRQWFGWDNIPDHYITMGESIARGLNLGYVGLDFIFDTDKNPYLIDINPTAGQNTTPRNLWRIWRAIKILANRGIIEMPTYRHKNIVRLFERGD